MFYKIGLSCTKGLPGFLWTVSNLHLSKFTPFSSTYSLPVLVSIACFTDARLRFKAIITILYGNFPARDKILTYLFIYASTLSPSTLGINQFKIILYRSFTNLIQFYNQTFQACWIRYLDLNTHVFPLCLVIYKMKRPYESE